MSDVSHEALAKQNFFLSANAHTPEWRVTMLFYAAVHAANHVLFGAGYAPANFVHANRDQRVTTDPTLKVVAAAYRELSSLSRTSRYMPSNHPMSVSKVNRAFTLAARVLQAAGISTQPPAPAAPTEPPRKLDRDHVSTRKRTAYTAIPDSIHYP